MAQELAERDIPPFEDLDQSELDALDSVQLANRFFDIATGELVRLDAHLDEWLATLANEAKSKDMKRSTIMKFAARFPHVRDVRRREVQAWVNDQVVREGKKTATT